MMVRELTGCSTGAQMSYPHHWWRTGTSWTWDAPPWGRLLYRAHAALVLFIFPSLPIKPLCNTYDSVIVKKVHIYCTVRSLHPYCLFLITELYIKMQL